LHPPAPSHIFDQWSGGFPSAKRREDSRGVGWGSKAGGIFAVSVGFAEVGGIFSDNSWSPSKELQLLDGKYPAPSPSSKPSLSSPCLLNFKEVILGFAGK